MSANVPEIPIAKATRLANIGPKYRNGIPGQLEFKAVKELYQVTDILPPPAETNHKTKAIDMNWVKLVERLEAMVPQLNDGQRGLLRTALEKVCEGL